MIAELDRIAIRAPRDDWVQGHRVGLRVKQGQLEEARRVARARRGTPWWCGALSGFVHHLLGEPAAAAADFEFALTRMPTEERCRWEDLSLLLDGPALAGDRGLSCEERIEVARWAWWAADPLFLDPGNERHAEHMARFVALRLHEQSLDLVGLRCTPAHRRSLIRQGWPEHWWSWQEPFVPVDGHPGQSFLPKGEGNLDPILAFDSHRGGTRAGDNGALEPEERGERMRSRLGPIRALTEQQIAHFRRGDSILPAGSYAIELTVDTGEGTPLRANRWIELR